MHRLLFAVAGLFLIVFACSNLSARVDHFQFPVKDYSIIQAFGNYNPYCPCASTVDKRHTAEDIAGEAEQ